MSSSLAGGNSTLYPNENGTRIYLSLNDLGDGHFDSAQWTSKDSPNGMDRALSQVVKEKHWKSGQWVLLLRIISPKFFLNWFFIKFSTEGALNFNECNLHQIFQHCVQKNCARLYWALLDSGSSQQNLKKKRSTLNHLNQVVSSQAIGSWTRQFSNSSNTSGLENFGKGIVSDGAAVPGIIWSQQLPRSRHHLQPRPCATGSPQRLRNISEKADHRRQVTRVVSHTLKISWSHDTDGKLWICKHNTDNASQQKRPKLCSEHLLVVVIGHLAKVPLAGEAQHSLTHMFHNVPHIFHIYSTYQFHCNVPPTVLYRLWSARDFGQRTMVTAFLGVPPVGGSKDTWERNTQPDIPIPGSGCQD